eukprot:gene162-3553_t
MRLALHTLSVRQQPSLRMSNCTELNDLLYNALEMARVGVSVRTLCGYDMAIEQQFLSVMPGNGIPCFKFP